MNIAVAGTGYVGLSLAVLLSQHNKVTAVDIVPEKVEKLNNYISPIQDEFIEKYLAEAKAGTRAECAFDNRAATGSCPGRISAKGRRSSSVPREKTCTAEDLCVVNQMRSRAESSFE